MTEFIFNKELLETYFFRISMRFEDISDNFSF